jgi:pimeloyl-ACP methyl ester carboxylesterase
MARQAPDRIAALVLIGAKAGHRPEPDVRERFIAALENDRPATLRKWVDDLLSPTAADDVRRHVHLLAEAQSLADLITGVRVFHGRRDASDVAAGWRKPLVVVHGEHDRTRAGLATLANQRIETVAGCGHYVNLERPRALNTILADIVKSCVAGEEFRAIGNRSG